MKSTLEFSLDAYVVDVLMVDLVGHDRAPSAFFVYLLLWRRVGGDARRTVAISYSTIASETGLSRASVQNAVRRLRRRKLITAEKEGPTATPRYRIMRPWRK